MLKIKKNASDENTVTGYMWQQILNNIGSQIRLYNGEKAEIIIRSLRGTSSRELCGLKFSFSRLLIYAAGGTE